MRLSNGFWQTYKETPNDAVIASHKLMIRAGLIHKAAGGLYNNLPMGLRALHKLEKIIREELDKAGCHELEMTIITPGELWQESGRWDGMSSEMLTIKDRGGRDLCISPTNEEAITDIFRKTISSYKQLPVTLYQIRTKFRDEIRPRYGVMRSREFLMKDAYSFHANVESMHQTYDVLYKVYEQILKRLGLKYIAVEADGGAMADGDAKTHEFQVLANSGEDRVISCRKCGYAANVEKAKTKRENLEFFNTDDQMVQIDTPGIYSIEDVSKLLKIALHQDLKCLLYNSVTGSEERSVLVVLLGDDQLNESKLQSLLGCDHLKAATDEDFARLGIPKGFVAPFGHESSIAIYYDCAVPLDAAYVTGAMIRDKHVKNFIPSRDGSTFKVVDLRESKTGDRCTDCGDKVEEIKGIEVGHIFELGDKYTKAMDVTILDPNGKKIHPLMGCYGMGVGRTVAAIIEQSHDDKGIKWPKAIAPYHLYFVLIGKSKEFIELGAEIYQELKNAGIEVIFDDRNAGPGFKFKDADLLGLPLCLVLGERDFGKDGMLELKSRAGEINMKIARDDIVVKVKECLEEVD